MCFSAEADVSVAIAAHLRRSQRPEEVQIHMA